MSKTFIIVLVSVLALAIGGSYLYMTQSFSGNNDIKFLDSKKTKSFQEILH